MTIYTNARYTSLDDEMWDLLASTVDHARVAITEVIPLDTVSVAAQPEAVRIARPYVVQVFDTWVAYKGRLHQAVADQGVTLSDGTITEDERDRRLVALLARVEADTAETVRTMTAAVDALLAKLTPIALPARPAPADGAQEARLAGLKSDALMVLDRIDGHAEPHELVARIGRLLEDAIAAGDALAVWLFASSGWCDLYLESRDLTELLARPLERELARILDRTPDQGVSAARAVLRVLQGGRGLASVIGAAHQLADKFTAPTRARVRR